MENAKQLLKTVEAAFPSYTFDPNLLRSSCESAPSNDLEEAQCAWARIHKMLDESRDADDANSQIQEALLHFLRVCQNVMSSTAGNYDLNRLYLGLFITGVAALFSSPTTYGLLAGSKYPGLFLVFSILSYGGMMFASSYVEEEQQFWYWIFTGWAFYLHVKSNGQQGQHVSPGSTSRQNYRSQTPSLAATGTIGFAIAFRVLRRWNQTGQKYAAEPDIARTFFPSNQNALWVLVILTYVDTYRHLFNSSSSLIWRLISFLVTSAAFIFKLAFVASDSPELLSESFLGSMGTMLNDVSLISQARIVFCGVGLMILFIMAASRATPGALGRNKG